MGIFLASALVLLGLADLLIPARDGLLGYSRVLAPYLALLFVPLGLIALWLRGRARWLLGGIVVVGLAIAAFRFLPVVPIGSAAADPALPQVRVTSWNLELGAVDAGPVIRTLAERAPGIVGLQELIPDLAEAIATDPDLRSAFPYQVLEPADDWTGMGLLSSWPIEGAAESSAWPPLIAATIVLPGGPPVDLVVAHPPPPTMGILRSGPRYDPGNRDASFEMLRERLHPSLEKGRPIVLFGDFNVTDRELGYAELSGGLTDSYRAAGTGWGHTWRPPSLAELPFGVLRLDMVLSSPGVTPIRSEPDCTPRGSDHCILDVVLTVGGTTRPSPSVGAIPTVGS